MTEPTAPARRIGPRVAGLVVLGLAAVVGTVAVAGFFGLMTQDPTHEIDSGYAVQLVLFGGVPTLLLLSGAGLLSWRAAQAHHGVRVAWAALMLFVGTLWAYVWLGFTYAPFSG